MDGDFSDHPEETAALVDPIIAGQADLVVGSRVLGRVNRRTHPPSLVRELVGLQTHASGLESPIHGLGTVPRYQVSAR